MPETIVTRRDSGLPYSKGLMAQSLSALGLAPERAYELARLVEQRLDESARERIDVAELRTVVEDVVRGEVGEEAVRRYRRWNRLDRLDRPLVVLLSGTTGVGKSTLATMLAGRLGVTRVIATDAVRQVLRAFFSREFMPAVHYSAFEAGQAVGTPSALGDPDLEGFDRQVQSLATGVAAIIERASEEGTPMVLEGVHLVPGALSEALRRRCLVVEALLVARDEQRHRAQLAARTAERPAARYIARFEQIRKLQDYLAERAAARGVAVIENDSVDVALARIMELILEAVGRVSPSQGG